MYTHFILAQRRIKGNWSGLFINSLIVHSTSDTDSAVHCDYSIRLKRLCSIRNSGTKTSGQYSIDRVGKNVETT